MLLRLVSKEIVKHFQIDLNELIWYLWLRWVYASLSRLRFYVGFVLVSHCLNFIILCFMWLLALFYIYWSNRLGWCHPLVDPCGLKPHSFYRIDVSVQCWLAYLSGETQTNRRLRVLDDKPSLFFVSFLNYLGLFQWYIWLFRSASGKWLLHGAHPCDHEWTSYLLFIVWFFDRIALFLLSILKAEMVRSLLYIHSLWTSWSKQLIVVEKLVTWIISKAGCLVHFLVWWKILLRIWYWWSCWFGRLLKWVCGNLRFDIACGSQFHSDGTVVWIEQIFIVGVSSGVLSSFMRHLFKVSFNDLI